MRVGMVFRTNYCPAVACATQTSVTSHENQYGSLRERVDGFTMIKKKKQLCDANGTRGANGTVRDGARLPNNYSLKNRVTLAPSMGPIWRRRSRHLCAILIINRRKEKNRCSVLPFFFRPMNLSDEDAGIRLKLNIGRRIINTFFFFIIKRSTNGEAPRIPYLFHSQKRIDSNSY